MCVVSMVGDHYSQKFQWVSPIPTGVPAITREEFDKLKREVQEMKALLKRAKKYDEETGQPNCEMEDKVDILKKVAEMVGVDLKEIFPE